MKLPKYTNHFVALLAASATLLALGIFYIKNAFLTFVIGWMAIPVMVFGFLIYGLVEYLKERKAQNTENVI